MILCSFDLSPLGRYFFDNQVNPDFGLGLVDTDGDPDHHRNLITWSLGHALWPLPLQEISSKSVHNFFSYPTDRQTDRSKNITSFFGGGKKNDVICTQVANPVFQKG